MKYLLIVLIICLQYSCKDKDEDQIIGGHWEKCHESFFQGGDARYNPVFFAGRDTLVYGLGEIPTFEEIYDIKDLWLYTKKGWSCIKDLPGRRRIDPLLVISDHKVYVGFGWNPCSGEALKDMWVYDITTQNWDSLHFEFPGNSAKGTVCFPLGGKLYYGLGEKDWGGGYSSEMYIFDIEQGWQQPFYTDRQVYSTIFELNGEIYSCFGKNDAGYIRTIRKFNPDAKKWEFVRAFDIDEYPFITRTGAKSFITRENKEEFVYILLGKPEENAADFWKCCRYNPRTQELEKVVITLPCPEEKIKAVFSIDGTGYLFDGEYVWKFVSEILPV